MSLSGVPLAAASSAPTVKAERYVASGKLIVLQAIVRPSRNWLSLPADTAEKMPAARLASIMSLRIGGAQTSTQPHELLITSGALDGSGLLPARSVGAMNHCMQSM